MRSSLRDGHEIGSAVWAVLGRHVVTQSRLIAMLGSHRACSAALLQQHSSRSHLVPQHKVVGSYMMQTWRLCALR